MLIDEYRKFIQQILTERAQRVSIYPNASEYEVQTIFDTEHDHYQLLSVGWRGNKQYFGWIALIEPPAMYYAVLYLYKDKGNCPLHALGAELWHGQEPKLRLKPIHCFGLTQSKIATYAGEVLAAFSQHCGTPLRQFKDQFEVLPERCPIRPCPLFGMSSDG